MSEAEKEFSISREFNAPRDLVFKAWTEPDRLLQWWGPKGFELVGVKVDLRPGGIFHYQMKAPNGMTMWGRFVYREITPPDRLVFVVSFSDENGGITRHPLSATWPLEMLSTVDFTEKDGKTTLHMRGTTINATDEEKRTFFEGHQSMQMGWGGTMQQLEEYLSKE